MQITVNEDVRNEHVAWEGTDRRGESGSVIYALVRKDLERYWKQAVGLAGVMAVSFAIPAVALKNASLQGYLIFTDAAIIMTFLPTQLGQWLVVHERLQRTIRFLKTLPISPSEVVWAKFLSAWLLVTASFVVFCLVPFAIGTLLADNDIRLLFMLTALYLIALLNAAFCVTLFLLFEKPLVAVVPFSMFALLGAAGLFLFQRLGLSQRPFVEAVLQSPVWQLALFAVLLVLWFGSLVGLFKLAKYGYRRIQG